MRAIAALAAALALASCATPQADALRSRAGPAGAALSPAGMRTANEIPDVPFYAQERQQCGPATLAMALAASGIVLQPDEFRADVFVPGRGGSLAPEMLAAARRRGRLAVRLSPDLESVLREVDAGHPVIIFQNLGLWFFPVWHFALVIGYDLHADRIVLHSGPEPREVLSLELFERTWARGEYWAMMALDPRELPVTTPIDELVDATAALERVDAGAARRAYTAITQRAPDAFGAWMGLGNSAYATGDPQSAAAAFARAADLQPLRADAWNNLASARLAIGDFAGAQEAVERAIGIGGEHRDVYERTAQEIAAGRTRQ